MLVSLYLYNRYTRENRRDNKEWTIQRQWQTKFEDAKGVIRNRK
jgi:hypothetical protein